MALKELFKRGIQSLLKKKKTDPVSGETQKLITYTPQSKTQTAKQLAKQDAQLPVKVDRKITDDLMMGETRQPAFGSAAYDWAMKKGPGNILLMNGSIILPLQEKLIIKFLENLLQELKGDQKNLLMIRDQDLLVKKLL